MKTILTSVLFFTLFHAKAQLNDNIWLFNQVDSNSFKIDFRQMLPYIDFLNINMTISFTNSSYSDNFGNLVCYSNGEIVNNKFGELIENGDSLNVGYWADTDGGYNVFNGGFFLPAPGDSTRLYYIYMFADHLPQANYIIDKLQYAIVDLSANNGLGKILEKRVPIMTGGLQQHYNHAGAVRHANGRDWWILVPSQMESKYYRILLSSDGFSLPEEQEIGFKTPNTNINYYYGLNLFSPDGNKYADYGFLTGVQFFDFDRCTGLLSNPIQVSYSPGPLDNNGQSGIAFSPSSRFAYLTYAKNFGLELKQYDMQASDIASSELLISSCELQSGPWVCGMSQMLLAPNGKIYVSALIDSSAMHVINKPDSLGLTCNFEYGGFDFPFDFPRTVMPYFPNYRLGPIDGSPCDTLGIDNIPVASFYWDATGLSADFSNVSYHEPDSFFWDFGEPMGPSSNTSTDVNPVHVYASPGTYNVCLTASNAYGSDTVCKLVEVDTLPAPPVLPVAAFTWDAVELEVTFMNNSYNAPTDFHWNFGDSGTSIEPNPVHTYAAPGSYYTCLIASNMNGSDTLCQLVVVDTLADPILPVAAFTWDAVELEVTFMNNSYNAPTDYQWDFSDGDTSIEPNPMHTYLNPGDFNVCLIASNMNGSDTLCQLVMVDTLLDSVNLVIQPNIQHSITVHPNPTSYQLKIEVNPPFSIKAIWVLHDVLGRDVASAVLSVGQQEVKVGLAGLAPGLYFWKLTSENGIHGSGKLLVAK